MFKNNKNRAGSEAQYGPRMAGEILQDYLEKSNEPLAVAYRKRAPQTEKQGWNRNTELCINLKLLTMQSGRMPVGAYLNGVLRHDEEDHFSFIQTLPLKEKRNPLVFAGRYINVHMRDDGLLNLNFRQLPEDMSVDSYALAVCNEIREALTGLVGEE